MNEKWPPTRFDNIVTVAMITYKDKPSERRYIKIAKQGAPAIDKIVSKYYQMPATKKARHSEIKVIKGINEIFEDSEKPCKRILIEGAPGIGKTVLAQHIASGWAKKEILPEIDILFILFLRDPNLRKLESNRDFVDYVGMGYFSDEQLADFTRQLENTKKVCFVLDGYDEYPNPQQRSFIIDLIYGGIIPNSLVVVTSRPIATLSLHRDIDFKKIEILGLAKEEREEYILRTLCNNSDIEKLGKYLKQQPIINGLCYIPLYLAILLFLFKQQCLPKSLTEMNEFFIIHTVYRHLCKYGKTFSHVAEKMTDLPIFNDHVIKLSTLAFRGLQNDQLVFKSTDVDFDIVNDQGVAKNGFGLLQAVQHYPKKGVGKEEISFNFLHFTMQEFLAAYYVTTLPSQRQFYYMKDTFWNHRYSFMWMMYVGRVGVKDDCFVKFISEGKTYKKGKKGLKITEAIKKDKKKQLHVFQCYMESRGNVAEMPVAISSMFKDGKVEFNKITLLSYHVSSLTSFMCTHATSVPWKMLKLKSCSLDDAAMNILELFILDNQEKAASFETVDLSENLSSPWVVYSAILKYCQVSSLTLYGDAKHEFMCYVDKLKDSLESNDELRVITLYGINCNELPFIKEILSCVTNLNAINLPLQHDTSEILIQSKYNNVNVNICGKFNNCTPQSIDISDQEIDDQTISCIAFGLQSNTVLKSLNISQNNISNVGLLAVGNSLKDNYGLIELDLSNNPFTSQGVINFVEDIQTNQRLSLQKLCISSLSVSDNGASSIGNFVNSNNTLQHFAMSNLREISSDGARMFVDACQCNETICVLDISDINLTDDGTKAISICINHNVIQDINLSKNKITKKGAKILAKAIRNNVSLITFNISKNWIDNEGVVHFLKKIIKNRDSKLQSLLVMGNMITKSCTKQMEEYFRENNVPLRTLKVYSSQSDLVVDTKGLIIETTMLTISMSGTHKNDDNEKCAVKEISDAEYRIRFVCSCLIQNDSLTSIKLPKMEITSKHAEMVAEVIEYNKVLQDLTIRHNSLGDDGLHGICNALKNNERLQTLDVSNNEISADGAKMLARALKEGCKLKKLIISENDIKTSGIVAILNSSSVLQELNVSNSNITEDTEKFKEIAEAIEGNTNLKILNLFQKSLIDKPVFHEHILHALKHNNTVTSLTLPWILHDDANEKVLKERIKEINEDRDHNGIVNLKCKF